MLQFESVFWASKNINELTRKLTALGFETQPSLNGTGLFFGPESIELVSGDSEDGIVRMSLESDDIVADYKRLKGWDTSLQKPQGLKSGNTPLWYGFQVPPSFTPGLKTWAVMNSPQVLEKYSAEVLPKTHPNSCFGIEGVHVLTQETAKKAEAWSRLVEKSNSGLHWNETIKTQGRRIQSGDRFFDLLESSKSGVFMLTLRVADLEHAKGICEKAGAKTKHCSNRDGFIVSEDFTGGPALRFVRSFWKKYLPRTNDNFPMGRRKDQFRPLGGAYSSTLIEGFQDNWDY